MPGLGDIFVEVMADADPFADDFADALEEAGQVASEELTGAMDDVTDDVAASLGEAGEAGGDALVSGIDDAMAGLDVDIDVDVAGAFDDIVAEAEGAADDTVSAFDGVTDSIQAAFDDIDLSGMADQAEENVAAITAATGGAALAGEGLARSMQDTEFALQRTGRMTGEGAEGMRDLALDLQNATFPMDEVTRLMELAAQRGLEGKDAIGEYAQFWDTVGDATGESSGALAEAGVALGLLGIEAGNEAEALDAFGFITDQTAGTVEGFLGFVERTALEMGDASPSVDEMAGALGALEDVGLSGQRAQRELRQALSETDGDMIAALETLGVSEDAYQEQVDAVEGSSEAIHANAEAYADLRTPGQKLEAMVESLGTRFGGFGGVISAATAPLAAVGPAIFGISQVGPMAAKALGGLSKAFLSLGKIILANPMFLIAALVIGIIALVWHFRDEIMGALGSAWEWVAETTGALLDWFSDAWEGLVEAVVGFVTDLVESVTGWFSDMRDRVVGFITDLVDRTVARALDLRDRFVAAVSDLFTRAVRFARELPGRILAGLQDLSRTVLRFINRYHPVAILWRAVRDLWPSVWNWLRSRPDAIIYAFRTLPRRMLNMGRDIIRGLWNGIRDMGSWLAGKIASFVTDRIPGPIARALGIGSPSQVAADLAREVPRGMVVGIEAELGGLRRAAEEAAAAALPDLAAPPVDFDVGRVRGGDGAGLGRTVVSRETRIEINVHGTDRPRRTGREVARSIRDRVYLDEPFDRPEVTGG